MVMPFQYPSNAMINFQPLDSALSDYQKGMQVAGESTARINAANAMKAGDNPAAVAELAKVDPRAAMELQMQPGKLESQKMENEKTARTLLGGTAEALSAIKDPVLQQQTLQKIMASDPRWAKGFAAAGFDINNPEHVGPAINFMREEATGPIRPEARRQLGAEAAKTEAEAAKAPYVPVPPEGTLYKAPPLGPGQTPAAGGGEAVYTAPEKIDKPGIAKADADVISAQNHLDNLIRMRGLSDKALGTFMPQTRAAAEKFIPDAIITPEYKEAANATRELERYATSGALQQLRQDIGSAKGMNQKIEQIELALRPGSQYTREQRNEMIDDMIRSTNRILSARQEAARALRGKTYYQPGSGPPPAGTTVENGEIPEGAPGSKSSPVYPANKAAAAALPKGTWFMDPAGQLIQKK